MDSNIKSDCLQKFYLQEKGVILESLTDDLGNGMIEATLRLGLLVLKTKANSSKSRKKGFILEPGHWPTEARLSLPLTEATQ